MVTGVSKVANDEVTSVVGLHDTAAVVVEGDAVAPNAEANEDFPNKLVDPNPSELASFLGAPNESTGVEVGTEGKIVLGS